VTGLRSEFLRFHETANNGLRHNRSLWQMRALTQCPNLGIPDVDSSGVLF